MRDPYLILGVDRDADAEAIKNAYRALAKRYHPDIAGANPASRDKFEEINAAYEVLRDQSKRQKYHANASSTEGSSSTSSGRRKEAQEFSGGQGYRTKRNGASRSAYSAGSSRQSFKTATRAAEAKRAAERHQNERPFGLDSLRAERPLDIGLNKADEIIGDIFSALKSKSKPVEDKRGLDEHYTLPITFQESARGGARRIKLPSGQILDVKIPAGIRAGQQVRLKNQGQSGEGTGPSGDALIKISIDEHAHFRREGDDIVIDLPITVDEAVLGARIMVPTVDGPTALTIPPESNSDTILTMKGLGFPMESEGPTKPLGNQRVALRVMLPPSSNRTFGQFIKKWASKNPYDVRSEFDI